MSHQGKWILKGWVENMKKERNQGRFNELRAFSSPGNVIELAFIYYSEYLNQVLNNGFLDLTTQQSTKHSVHKNQESHIIWK